MKATMAPLYIRAMDLTKWVLGRVAALPDERRGTLSSRLEGHSLDLLEQVSMALAQRNGRLDRLYHIQESLMGLRLAGRLSRELGILKSSQADFLLTEVDHIGAMLGGWIKQEAHGKGHLPPRNLDTCGSGGEGEQR